MIDRSASLERPRTPRIRRYGLGVILAGLVAFASPGCDRIEAVKQAASPSAEGDDRNPAPADDPTKSTAAPSMDSIGPDEAQRVYYQFIDDKGRVQFVERLTDVPTTWRDQVGYVEMNQPPPLSPEEARRSWQVSEARAMEIQLAAQSATPNDSWGGAGGQDVILYSATWCGYCTKARAHLDEAGVRYDLRDVDIPAIGQELREKTGRGGVPVLDFSGEILRGYSRDHYDRVIESIRG